jgi:hypothetical protein
VDREYADEANDVVGLSARCEVEECATESRPVPDDTGIEKIEPVEERESISIIVAVPFGSAGGCGGGNPLKRDDR